MNNGTHPADLDEVARRRRIEIPSFMKDSPVSSIETQIATIVATERPAGTTNATAAAAAASNVENMLAELAKLIRVPQDVPAIGVDAALKVTKCFEIVAADIRKIAADRVQAAKELEQEAETYATVLLDAGRVLASKTAAETARAYKLSMILREAREVIAGPLPSEERS